MLGSVVVLHIVGGFTTYNITTPVLNRQGFGIQSFLEPLFNQFFPKKKGMCLSCVWLCVLNAKLTLCLTFCVRQMCLSFVLSFPWSYWDPFAFVSIEHSAWWNSLRTFHDTLGFQYLFTISRFWRFSVTPYLISKLRVATHCWRLLLA